MNHSKLHSHDGRALTSAEWANELGITTNAFNYRLRHSPEHAFVKGRIKRELNKQAKPEPKPLHQINRPYFTFSGGGRLKHSCKAPAPEDPTGGPSETFSNHPMTGRPSHVSDFDS